VLVSPLIPGLTDQDLERVLEASAQAGVSRAGCLLIRLPLEIKDLFTDWLRAHFPERAEKVLSLIRQCRSGKLNDAHFGTRFVGTGPIAGLLQQRFDLVAGRFGLLRRDAGWELDSTRFRAPGPGAVQLSLFGQDPGR
jgi:DNA repair photolyase